MRQNIRVAVLAFVALVAVGAIAAQAASAHEFKSGSSPTALHGFEEAGTNDQFTVGGFAVAECDRSEFAGTVSGTESDLWILHPEYAECAFFEEEAAVLTTGCNYWLDSDTSGEDAPAVISCGFFGILIETSACSVEFDLQIPDGGARFSNVSGGDVTIDWTFRNVEASGWEGPLCFLLENEGTITMDYDGVAVIAGLTDPGGTPTNISVE